MRLLVVDIGNTDIKFVLFNGMLLLSQWRLKESPPYSWTEENVAALAESWFQSFIRNIPHDGSAQQNKIQGLIYSNVRSSLGENFPAVLQKAFQLPDNVVLEANAPTMRFPVNFQRYPLTQLGADRLVNSCAANLLYPNQSCVVMDFGTATTVDVILSNGDYQGGMITVGFQTFWESLSMKTAKLPIPSMPEQSLSVSGLGTDTISCLQSGLITGYRGLIKEILSLVPKSDDRKWVYIATGGLAQPVIDLCHLSPLFDSVRPNLTLEGLAALYHYQMQGHYIFENGYSPSNQKKST